MQAEYRIPKLDAAVPVLLDIVRICREKHPKAAVLAGSLGHSITTLINLDRAVEAEPLARELLAWCEARGVREVTLGRCHLWIARTAYAQAKYDEVQASLAIASEYFHGNVADDDWLLCLTQMLDHMDALRRGSPDRAANAKDAYNRLIEQSTKMRSEDRETILPEARRILTEAGIEPGVSR